MKVLFKTIIEKIKGDERNNKCKNKFTTFYVSCDILPPFGHK